MSTPEQPDRARYASIADLFHRALDLPAAARAAFVLTLRSDDPALAAEVEALLAAHDRAADFIERPAFEREQVAAAAAQMEIPRDPIGHYRVLSVIGEGGMGVVYLAEDTRLGRTVALKTVRTKFGDDTTRTARLRREARAAAALRHRNIATVYALEEIDGRLYIASEYIPGDTLRDELARGPMAPTAVLDTAIAMARALAAAHDRGIVHRDLKPENVVRAPSGDLKILDFGLAQFADLDGDDGLRTADGAVLGTPAYMSPEQIRGTTVDGRSDLFALGVVVYELLTGRHPFAGRTPSATIARVLEEPPVALGDALPAGARTDPAAGALQAVVANCLQKAPASRPQHAAEVVATLERARAGPAPAAVPGRPLPPAWWWQFHQGATTLAYVLLLIPLWRVRDMTSGSVWMAFFLTGLVAVVVAGALRLHLWFAMRQYPSEWVTERDVERRLIHVADVIFTLVLAARGVSAIRIAAASSVLLIAAAASVAVSFVIIEPATTRAMKDRF